MEGLVEDLRSDTRTLSAIEGDPGTGKTIVGIYLMKLLRDLAEFDPTDDIDGDSMLSISSSRGTAQLFQDLRIGLVVPQKSLRKSITKVFRKAPALRGAQVLTPYDVADADEDFDVIVVDEAHRLTQRVPVLRHPHEALWRDHPPPVRGGRLLDQPARLGPQTRPPHDPAARHGAERPADHIEPEVFQRVLAETREQKRLYPLDTQMRVKGGKEYLEFARALISDDPPARVPDLGDYEFEIFDDLGDMHERIRERDAE